MSWYEMHRCVYDFIRSNEGDVGQRQSFDVDRYDLTDQERAAFDTKDIAAFYTLGLHCVLLNRYAREVGTSLAEYRALLQPLGVDDGKVGRWQTSS